MTKYYLYYHPGEPEPKNPEEWDHTLYEYDAHDPQWMRVHKWDDNTRLYRREVSQDEYRSHHWMKAYGISRLPEGCVIESFGCLSHFYPRRDTAIWLTPSGEVGSYSKIPFPVQACPILKRVEPEIEWVTPTDEDSCFRPDVQVKSAGGASFGYYMIARLIGVDGSDEPFVAILKGAKNITNWRWCRMDARWRDPEWRAALMKERGE